MSDIMHLPASTVPRQVSRPKSEVSDATGLMGALTLSCLLVIVVKYDFSLLATSFCLLGGTALVMVLWDITVEKVHRRPSTGLDLGLRRPWPEVFDLTATKYLGMCGTFALLALAYFCLKTYSDPAYDGYFSVLLTILPVVAVMAPVYMAWTSRRMVEPQDGLWHMGMLVSLNLEVVDWKQITDHLLVWTVKGFFLAFMASIVPYQLGLAVTLEPADLLENSVAAILLLVQLTFLYDVCFGTIGYILTFRVLDSHIRSANPYLSGWTAALVCYPPFSLMTTGGPLDYLSGTQEWMVWLSGKPVMSVVWGGTILGLAIVYAWATVVFGIRFSNLTHRGIITAGPYRFVRHPAYLAKNLMWWMVYLPFLSTVGGAEAFRNCVLLLGVNALYYARARTEEKHLLSDPHYLAYHAWIAENGLLPRMSQALRRRAVSSVIR